MHQYTALPTLLAVAQPGWQPGTQRDSASQILTQAAQEELRKFLGKQRALEVNFSSKSLRGCGSCGRSGVGALWVISSACSGSTLGWCQDLPGPSRAPQSSRCYPSVTNPSLFPPTPKTKMPNCCLRRVRHQQKCRISPATPSLKNLILIWHPAELGVALDSLGVVMPAGSRNLSEEGAAVRAPSLTGATLCSWFALDSNWTPGRGGA